GPGRLERGSAIAFQRSPARDDRRTRDLAQGGEAMMRLGLAVLLALGSVDDEAIMMANARIVCVTGETIEKGFLVIRDGKITELGGGRTQSKGRVVDF